MGLNVPKGLEHNCLIKTANGKCDITAKSKAGLIRMQCSGISLMEGAMEF